MRNNIASVGVGKSHVFSLRRAKTFLQGRTISFMDALFYNSAAFRQRYIFGFVGTTIVGDNDFIFDSTAIKGVIYFVDNTSYGLLFI